MTITAQEYWIIAPIGNIWWKGGPEGVNDARKAAFAAGLYPVTYRETSDGKIQRWAGGEWIEED